MKLIQLSLENFRGIEEIELNISGKNLVLIGSNGVGKSSVLDATNILLSRIVELIAFGQPKRVSIKDSDITNGKQRLILSATFSHHEEQGKIELTKAREKKPKTKPKYFIDDNMKGIVNKIHKLLEEPQSSTPVVVYYPVSRNVIDIPLRIRTKHDFNQLSAYQNSFASGSDFRVFFEWFRNQEDLENEEKLQTDLNFRDNQLHAVRTAIHSFMPGFSDLKVVRKGSMKMVISKGNKRLEVNQLSDGEKCTLAMIGDLARRLAIANPGLENPLLGSGLVLIDEIELHLHPEWQRKIVSRFKTVFPNVQFIITTHSPQILGELTDARIYSLNYNEKREIDVAVVNTLFGKDTNLILEQYMGSSEKNEHIKIQFQKLFKLILETKLIEARKLMVHLKNVIGSDDPELIKAEILLKRKESSLK